LGEWKKITKSAQTSLSSKIMRITDNNTGKTIKCTPDHQIFTKNRGYICAKDLTEHDELVIG
jgi:intein/homing endonuclease